MIIHIFVGFWGHLGLITLISQIFKCLSKFFPNDKPFLTSINWYIGEDKKFLVAEVGSGLKQIYLTFKNEKRLYVRNGPESELYTNPDDIIEYIKVRFPDTLSL